MLFVKTEDLKQGMRLARPIYNKNGVLLFERDSRLTKQGIDSVKNFGLIGLFVLEPAEPVPPMTQEDLDFERFQTMAVFQIKDELDYIVRMGKPSKLQSIVDSLIKNYGHLDRSINFVQNLRSGEDYTYKHALNVALLCTMMTHVLNMRVDERQDVIIAALLHDIGIIPLLLNQKERYKLDDPSVVHAAKVDGLRIIENTFASSPNIKRICFQCQRILDKFEEGDGYQNIKLVEGAKILVVAEVFDTMTAMQLDKEPDSEVAAIKHLLENPDLFDPKVVDALISSINILTPGVSVELNTGAKALVLAANKVNILRPMLLCFEDNSIIDLGNEFIYGDMEIVDIMKTMDNRHIMDMAALKKQGFDVEEPEYVAVTAGKE